MSDDIRQLLTIDVRPASNVAETKTNISRTREMKKNDRLSVPIPVPRTLDVRINDQCTSSYQCCPGNRRMNDVILEYKAPFHSATADERSRIVETVLVKITAGGVRFLREIPTRDEGCIRWEEVSRDVAAQWILCALQTQDLGIIKKRKACVKTVAFPGPEGLIADAEVHPSHPDDHDIRSDNLNFSNVDGHVSQKKQKIQSDATRSTQACDIDVSCRHLSIKSYDANDATRPIPSSESVSCHSRQRLLPSGQLLSTVSAISVQQSVESLLEVIVHHLSNAVSAARFLTFLHSLEGASSSSTMEIYEAMAPLVQQIADTTTRVVDQPRGFDPLLDGNVVETGIVSDSRLPVGTRPSSVSSIPDQDLLEASFLLTQTIHASGNINDWNRCQAAVQVMHMVLEASSRDRSPAT